MQTVILAGGFGTRLQPFTNFLPKCMMDVNGKPFLEHQLELLKKNGFTDIILSIGYMGNEIKEYFSDRDMSMNITFSQEDSPLGTGGALRLIKEKGIKLDDCFFVINGDTYLDMDYKKTFKLFDNFQTIADGLIIGNNMTKNNLTINSVGGKVEKYEKGSSDGNMTDAGVILIKKEVLNYIDPNKKVSFEEEIYPILINKRKLLANFSINPFYDIGTIKGLNKFRELMAKF